MEYLGTNISKLPGVSMTLTTWPSLSTVVFISQVLVTPDKSALALKALLPRILLPVALLPLPVRPSKPTMHSPLDGEVGFQLPSITLSPILKKKSIYLQCIYNINHFLSFNNKKENLVTIPIQFHSIKTYICYYFKYYPTEHG